jgi:ubiquinone/menaquinone biosynthesis C-methylase UbiE
MALPSSANLSHLKAPHLVQQVYRLQYTSMTSADAVGRRSLWPAREARMDANLQRRVQRYGWDKAAPYYERSWQAQLEPAQSALLDAVDLKPGDRILDVACGTGLVTFRVAAKIAPGQVVGADLSEQMILAARAAASARECCNARFERMDAEQLNLGDGSFDAALCSLGLMYMPNPERAVGELHRVLRAGGRAAAAVWGRRGRCGWAEIFPIVDARVRSEVCPMFFRLGTGDALQHAFAAAGFGEIAVKRLETRLRYATGDEACEAAFAGGPAGLAYSRFSETAKLEAHSAYLASIEAYREGGGYSVPGEFVVAVGTK